jgi:hypothetical protein
LDLVQESLSVTTILLLEDFQHLKFNLGEWEVHENVPPLVLTICNNCDTSNEYIQQHYVHYDAKRATTALATGRKHLKAAKGEK